MTKKRLNKDEHEIMRANPVILVPVAEYETEGHVRGLILPTGTTNPDDPYEDGAVLMEMKGRSEMVLTLYSHSLDAKKFSIKGKWVFHPDPETLRVDPHNTNHRSK